MTSYRVRIARDEGGVWLASVPDVPGCHTYGRSIAQALNRTREALALWVDDAEDAELVPDLQLPADLRRLAAQLERIRERERQAHEQAQAVLREALVGAVLGSRLSIRDTARIVGLSPQRVQQLVENVKHERRAAARPPAKATARKAS